MSGSASSHQRATCPQCRARLGLRTVFALGDLWDSRIRNIGNIALSFRCHACARLLRYPINTLASFLALAVLPVVLMALFRDFELPAWSTSIAILLAPYWVGLGAGYSVIASPTLATTSARSRP